MMHCKPGPNGAIQSEEVDTMSNQVREGGCQCGEIRYSISGDPLGVVACHCRQCQAQSGSAFGMTMVVLRTSFQWLAGEPRIYATQAESGTDKKCMFCGKCGSRILNELSTLPDTYNVKPGTLDDTSWFSPTAHTWVSKKQPWTYIPEDMITFEENPK
jgi:hypothetical protein